MAQSLFEYLTDFHISKVDPAAFRAVAFIPSRGVNNVKRFYTPQQCLLPPAAASVASFYAHLFDFVDYGSKANLFLRAAGVSDMPTPNQVATALIGICFMKGKAHTHKHTFFTLFILLNAYTAILQHLDARKPYDYLFTFFFPFPRKSREVSGGRRPRHLLAVHA